MTSPQNLPPPFTTEKNLHWIRIKDRLRKVRHYAKVVLKKYALNRFLSRILGPLAGFYYLFLDVFRSDFDWIDKNIDLHIRIVFGMMAATVIAHLLSSFVKETAPNGSNNPTRAMAEFIKTVGIIVEEKIQRYTAIMGSLPKRGDLLMQITKPDDQILRIFKNTANFIENVFGVKTSDIDITILKRDLPNGKWNTISVYQDKWKHFDPDGIVKNSGAAQECLRKGDPVFIPNKLEAHDRKAFILNSRDRTAGPGSAFLYPVPIKTNQTSCEYLVSILTYRQQLCDSWDSDSIQAAESFLNQICRRIELELIVWQIKQTKSKV